MTRSNVEKSSINWKEIKRRYEGEPCSIKALARDHETTDTRIHRHAKANGWKLFSPPQRGTATRPQRRPRSAEVVQVGPPSDSVPVANLRRDDGVDDPTIPHPTAIARMRCASIWTPPSRTFT